LVTADDLNAVMTYVQSRERLIQQLAGGWGILGGLQVQGMGGKTWNLALAGEVQTFAPGITTKPEAVLGSVIQVTRGTAIDSAGQLLTSSLSQPLDLRKAAEQLGAPQRTATCEEWLGSGVCEHVALVDLTAAEFWVVAEYAETPTRPMPALVGGGQCETGAQCDFTRKQPGIKLSVVKDLPLAFFLTGCLDTPHIPGLDAFLQVIFQGDEGEGPVEEPPVEEPILAVDPEPLATAGFSPRNANTGANAAVTYAFSDLNYRTLPQLYEFLANISWSACCSRPAVALGRVLLVSQCDKFRVELGESPYYALLDQGFPYRRAAPSNAAFQMATLLHQLGGLSG